MTKRIALVCVLALAMGLMASSALANNAASGDKSTGGVEFTSAATGADVKASFNAHGDVDDAKGRVNVRGHVDWNTQTEADFKGDVDCYFNRGPDSATFTGSITHFDGEGPEGFFRITVEDSGPGSAVPDRITVNRSEEEFDCTDDHTANNPVTKGNLVVHH